MTASTLLSVLAPLRALRAQGPSDLIVQADRESAARRTAPALALYERALQLDARSYAALCGAARDAVDLGEFERDEATRLALYGKATAYARRAVQVSPNDAEGHFHLARALGRTALALGPKDRVKYAIEVRDNALKALELKPRHAGALHVMGVWNAEVMRLNGFSRAVAKAFLGGQVLGSANWAEAARYLEQSVVAEPERLVHRLDLARVYRDMGRTEDARAAYRAALACALSDANDARYRQSAEDELRKLR